MKIESIQILKSIDWKPFNLYQIFIALTGTILDLFTTRMALLHNPYVIEGNTYYGNIPWIDIPIIIIGVSILQLFKVYYHIKGNKGAFMVMNISSWLCLLLPYMATINNLMLIP